MEKSEKILEALEILSYAVKFNSVNTLIPYPLFQSPAVMFSNKEMIEITKNNYYEIIDRLIDLIRERIKGRDDPVMSILIMVSSPYRIQYLDLIKNDITTQELSESLSWIWIDTEFPNQYSTELLLNLFELADKQTLMNEEELNGLKILPNEVVVYRGVQTERAKVKGMSWTLNKDKAAWFANRWKKGKVYRATIKKNAIIAYFKERSEEEIVVNPRKLKEVNREL